MGKSHFVKHAIQLEGILVRELFIRVHPNNTYRNNEEKGHFQLETGHFNFDKEISEIDVGITIKIGKPDIPEGNENDTEFDLKVHLLAKFSVDQSQFPIEKIEHWAENNAPLILYPYIREHVHSLSIRAGIRPILLPLMEVPTLRIECQ